MKKLTDDGGWNIETLTGAQQRIRELELRIKASANAEIRIEQAQTRIREQQAALHEQLMKTEELARRISRAREILKGIRYDTMPIVVRQALDALEGK